jgi:hypothetical protein
VTRKAAALLILLLLLALAHPLEQWLRAEAPPAPEANRIGVGRLLGGVLTGAFRPVLQTYLFLRQDILYGQGRSDELLVLYRTMISLYPRNERAREHFGWHMAFNLKQEAPSDLIAWRWADEGIEVLAGTPSARRTLTDWFMKQAGQNPTDLLRYGGEVWVREKWWREKLRAWSAERYGEPMERFDIALTALGDSDLFLDRLWRFTALRFKAIDDWVRRGHTDRLEETVALGEWIAGQADNEAIPAPPGWREMYEREIAVLQTLAAGRITPELLEQGRYDVAMALFGLGAHGRDRTLLAAAEAALLAVQIRQQSPFPDELDLIRRWIAHLDGPEATDRPALPFD